MATPTLILGANNWAIEEDNILGYALGSSSNQYLPREIFFTRGSDATYTDSTGVVRQACWNLLQQSEDFTSGVWGKQNTTITANSTNAPDSALTADQMFDDTSLNWHRIIYTTSVISGNAYTYSIYLKANTETAVQLNTYNIYASNSFNYANFDLQNGVVGAYANCTPSITNIGNGWYRCSITQTSVVSGTSYLYVTTTNNNPLSSDRPVYAGAGNSFYVWGAQLVQGSDALGYLRTTDRLNMPRVDSSTGSKAFLVEPQRTNLALYSNDFTNVVWSKSGATVTPNTTISPDGTQNASTVVFSGVDKYVTQGCFTLGTSATSSVWVKGTSGETITIACGGTDQVFTLNGSWQRLSVSRASTSNIYANINTFLGATARTIYVYGFQAEVGAYPTTYIPTQATTVTRIADASRKTGLSSLIGQTEGTLLTDLYYVPLQMQARAIAITESSNPVANRLIININNTNNRVSVISRQNNTILSGSISESAATTLLNGRNKIALGYKSGDSVLYINGVLVATNTDSFTFSATLNDLFLMTSEISLVADNLGILNTSQIYNTRLTNAELAALTTL